ncbi:CBS domain-containing protein CBSX1 chloroplastic [Euphorbia peplus]|nr:CBS domain-containing protein CBSX1 chloroplastic [Euphorbia peplus]
MTSVPLTSTPPSLIHSLFISPHSPILLPPSSTPLRRRLCSRRRSDLTRRSSVFSALTNNGMARNGAFNVGDIMTRKEDLFAVKTTTTADEALEALVEKKLSGFPVVDDDGTLVGVVSDYDLLALNSISGGNQGSTSLFPDTDSSWKKFNEMQKLVTKNNGKVVGDLMTPAPLVVSETTNLEDAARLLLDSKHHRLPVVDSKGRLVGMIARENIVRAALHIRRTDESSR